MADNQDVYKNKQTIKLDINQIYDTFIKQIDSLRSFINVNNPSNANLLNNIKSTGISINTLSIEEKYQESRIHAFYRLVGFPVLGSGDLFYNPGFDLTKKTNITNEYKASVINNPIEGYYKFSSIKEDYYSKTVKSFFRDQGIQSACYSLSIYNIRDFEYLNTKYANPIDFEPESQSYEVNLRDSLKRLLTEYEDSSGNKAESLSSKRYHYLFPLMVDGRIDISCSKKVAVPFVPDNTYLNVNEGYKAARPYLEKVIRERFDYNNNTKSLGDSFSNELNRIELQKIYNETDIIDKVYGNDLYGLSEKNQFYRFINFSQAIAERINYCTSEINQTQNKTYWVPIPSLDGPEFSITTENVFLESAKTLQSKLDLDICNIQTKIILQTLNSQINKTNDSNSIFTFDPFNATAQDKHQGSDSILDSELTKLIKYRSGAYKRSELALRELEILTGEFSGLGFIDIIVIITSLYLVDKIYILGLLDEDAYNRAKLIIGFSEEKASIKNSILEIQKKCIELYSVFNSILKASYSS